MGCYINPPNCTKEAYLEQHGTRVSEDDYAFKFDGAHLPVCLVDNGFFTAAAIAYNPRERDAFLPTRQDNRDRLYYIVPISTLLDLTLTGETGLPNFLNRA